MNHMNPHHELMMAEGYATAPAVAEAIGVNLSTVHRWVATKKVVAARSERRLYIKLDSLLVLFSQNEVVLTRIATLRKQAA